MTKSIKVLNRAIYVNDMPVAILLGHIREEDVREDIDAQLFSPEEASAEEVNLHFEAVEAENAGAN